MEQRMSEILAQYAEMAAEVRESALRGVRVAQEQIGPLEETAQQTQQQYDDAVQRLAELRDLGEQRVAGYETLVAQREELVRALDVTRRSAAAQLDQGRRMLESAERFLENDVREDLRMMVFLESLEVPDLDHSA
jgi:hypothetical protein